MRDISTGNMNSARMATVTAVTFIVAFAPVLCGRAQKTADPHTGDCSAAQTGEQVVNVNAPCTVTLKCNTQYKAQMKPQFSDDTKQFKVCKQQACTDTPLLSDYIDGATGKKKEDGTATVEITKLPSTATDFYILCGGPKQNPCYILVKVAKASNTPTVDGSHSGVPGGAAGSTGGVTTGTQLSCATPGTAITIKIPEKGSTVQFTCGELTLYPRARDRVFAEDCKKEESLKDIVRSDKAPVYTLTADKKPPKKKWCYLCARSSVSSSHLGQASDYCLVHVESSSRTQSSSAIALAAMVPCVLAMLRIT